MEKFELTKITCQIFREAAPRVQKLLREIGVSEYHIQLSKSSVLQEQKGVLFFPSKTVLGEDPLDFYEFYISSGQETAVLSRLIQDLELFIPGRGSAFSERVELQEKEPLFLNRNVKASLPAAQPFLAEDLSGICCIVQRGEGNAIVQAALDMGSTVPVVTYGEGTGLRNKLGLLRITIPAEKEIIHVVVGSSDLNEIRDRLIDIGRIDQPGKGFIYDYSVGKGFINSKIFYGKQKYVASMEQVILAIDNISNSTEWRRRFAEGNREKTSRRFLKGLVKMNVICNDGRAMDLVTAAMAAGAAGATISRAKYINLDGEVTESIASAREMADMIIGEKNIDVIMAAIENAGLSDSKTRGVVEIKPVNEACTYIPG